MTSWIANWKTTNFGIGTYDNSGSISIYPDAKIDASYTSIEIGSESGLYFKTGLVGGILFGNENIEIKCYAGFGLYVDGNAGVSRFSISNERERSLYLWQILFRPNKAPTVQSLKNLSVGETRNFTRYKDGTLWLFAWSIANS